MGPAIIDHYFHAITDMVTAYRDGEWVKVPALSEPECFEFPSPIGAWEVAHVGHPEPVTIPATSRSATCTTRAAFGPPS